MATLGINAAGAATALTGTEKFPVIQGANNRYATPSQIATFLAFSGSAGAFKLALGGATIGTDALAVTGTATISSSLAINGFYTDGASVGTTNANGYLFLGTSALTRIRIDAPYTLALGYDTNPNILRVYNTSSAANANYARGVFDTATAGTLTIGTQTLGTGVGTFGKIKFISEGTNILDYGVTAASVWTFPSSANIVCNRIDLSTFVVGNLIGITSNNITNVSPGVIGFNATNWFSAADIAFSRISAGVIGVGNGTPADVSGTIQAAKFTVTSATALVASNIAMNNGAAAATGTLTNAPAAGNPTKWIPINDNGTTRYIPCW